MEVLLSSLVSGSLLILSLILLTTLCLSCWRSSNHTSIVQNFGEGDYEHYQSGQGAFHVVRAPYSSPLPPGSISVSGPSMDRLVLTSPVPENNRRSSFTPLSNQDSISRNETSDTEEADYINAEEPDAPYIHVLPDCETVALSVSPSQKSILSTQSSANENYVNVNDYINVDESAIPLTPGYSQESLESEGNSSADYVNTSHM